MSNQRLNLVIAKSGLASRRKADQLIASGSVTIDGKIVRTLGIKVDPKSHEIAVDGIPLSAPVKYHKYFAFHKPRNVVTTMSDPEGRPSVHEYIPKGIRLFPVGRLDYDSEGLLLVMSDGDLAHQLMHPKFGAKRTYLVKVKGRPEPEVISKLKRGIKLEDGFVKPLELKFEKPAMENNWYRMTVAEGRNRMIKRMWLRVKHPVVKLIRVEYAGIALGELKPGHLRPLKTHEIDTLRKLIRA